MAQAMTPDTISADEVWDRIGDEHVCMLVTHDGSRVEARPMSPMIDREARAIRFLTGDPSEKTDEIKADATVTLVFCDPGEGVYASVEGRANLSRDPELLRSLWSSVADAYFPEGPDSGRVAVLTVTPSTAQFWEEASSVTQAWELLKANMMDTTPDLGRAGETRM